MFDLSSNHCFHLRISGEKEELLDVVLAFHKKWPMEKFVCGYEQKGTNHHCHLHIQYDASMSMYHQSKAGKSARSAFFDKHEYSGAYNFQKLVKPPINNILYVIKDLDIMAFGNLTEEEIEKYEEMTKAINCSKKMDTREKLLIAFREQYKDIPKMLPNTDPLLAGLGQTIYNDEYPHKLHQIATFIHWHFINTYDKPPPVIHMREYVLWIASKECDMNTKDYYYNIFKD